jgi:hypothetical protein
MANHETNTCSCNTKITLRAEKNAACFDYEMITSIKPELQENGSFFTIVIVLRDLNLFNLITLVNTTFCIF